MILLIVGGCSSSSPRAAVGVARISRPVPVIDGATIQGGRFTPDAYRVTRQKGTERAFTGEYWNTKTPGVFHCVCRGQPLFESGTKFESGSGWPSFYEPAVAENVDLHRDISHGMIRTEVRCGNCGGHLGHVFDDGPNPTGLRFCINSCSLDLQTAD